MKTMLLIVLGALLFSYQIYADEAAPAEQAPYQATVDKDGVQRVTVVGGGYYFKPNRIIVKVNTPVELTVSKEGGTPHNFVIQAPDAGINVEEDLSAQPKTISFTPTAVGEYPFYCSKKLLFFKSHREKGMEGMLEVVQ